MTSMAIVAREYCGDGDGMLRRGFVKQNAWSFFVVAPHALMPMDIQILVVAFDGTGRKYCKTALIGDAYGVSRHFLPDTRRDAREEEVDSVKLIMIWRITIIPL